MPSPSVVEGAAESSGPAQNITGRQSVSIGSYSLAPTTKTTVVSTTTTTTTTTNFPPLVLNPPRRRKLRSEVRSDVDLFQDEVLDPLVYPLADQPTPAALRSFSFELGGRVSHFSESANSSEPLIDLQQMLVDGYNSERRTQRAESRTITTTTRTTSTSDGVTAFKVDEATSRKRAGSPSGAQPSGPVDINKAVSRIHKRRMMSKDQLDMSTPSLENSPRQQDGLTVEPTIPNDTAQNTPSIGLGLATPLSAAPRGAVITAEPDISTDEKMESCSALSIDIQAAQAANPVDPLSLPSPSLSPVTGSQRKSNAQDYFSSQDEDDRSSVPDAVLNSHAVMMQIPTMLDTFDALPENVQDYVMYQFLRRCSKKTLSVVASTVIPALRCDFIALLPQELVANILQYLDVKSLCIAAQVSRTWKQAVDGSLYTWRKLLETDGFALQHGEMERAIREGWGMEGWTKPVPPPPSPPTDSMSSPEVSMVGDEMEEFINLPPSNKRKRGSKKKPSGKRKYSTPSQTSVVFDGTGQYESNSSNTSLPFPNMYKAIYRRHYLINRNWMSPKSTPNHLSFAGHGRNVVTCLQFDSERIITGSDDLCINVYDTRTGKLRARLDGHEGGVWALQYVGNTLVSGSTDRTVRVWDIEKGICTHIFYGHTSTVRCLEIMQPVRTGTTPDGKPIVEPSEPIIVTGSRDASLRIWKLPDLETDAEYLPETVPDNDDGPFFLRALHGHTHSVRAISGHGDLLVSGSYDTFVRVWKISTGECLFRLAGHGAKVYSVVIDSKRSRCISGSMDWLVKVWSLETGSCLYTLEGHTSLVGLLDLNQTSLVSAAADSTLRVWDPETGDFVYKLEGHTGAITCFQHDDYKVVSGSDGTLKLWNIKTGKVVKDLLSDLNRVWQVRFDDRRCVAAVQRGADTFIEVLNFDYDPTTRPPPTYATGSQIEQVA
ncbi:WD40-repeat-containing domain protein [Lipomyces tetrasporus]|uniref:WD40-repeat-containing domain protein n=1 Tax=Lipomyces tetrasporus TaxID=54092 RepID=A0AAD7VP76_9ASCO|nr:WD40-repeat-containing domain protein [Lipomyces tetrasporus]KAJ8096758.1 WD40-repeat-containing domain protein [Lipomyces tetrasporus]